MLGLILSGLLLTTTWAAQDERRVIDPKIVPLSGEQTQSFVPHGWKLQDEQSGDLNGDGLPDTVLQIIEDKPARDEKDEFHERYRALLIVFKTNDGKYARAAVAGKLLMCASCGGMLGGAGDSPAADVQIEKGILIVSQLSGSRQSTDILNRFRYDAKAKQFLLIGQDITRVDRLTLENETISTNYLTGKQVTEKYRYNQKADKEILVTKKSKTVPRTKKTIEQVDYEQ